MFTETRERKRESMDQRFGEGELRDVVEAKYPTLKLDKLIAQGVVKQMGEMVYLPKHTIGKTDTYTEKSTGSRTQDISKDDFDALSAGIGAMLSDTADQLPSLGQIGTKDPQAHCFLVRVSATGLISINGSSAVVVLIPIN